MGSQWLPLGLNWARASDRRRRLDRPRAFPSLLREGPVSSAATAFTPAAVTLSAKACPDWSRRQIGAPAFALISFTNPALRSVPPALWARLRFGPVGGTRQLSLRREAAPSSRSCVSVNLIDMIEPSHLGSRPIRPLTDASPGSQRSGRRAHPQRPSARGRPHTCSLSNQRPVFSSSASAMIEWIHQRPRPAVHSRTAKGLDALTRRDDFRA